MARAILVFTSDDGLVRCVKIQLALNKLDRNGKRKNEPTFLKRLVHKQIILIEA